MEGVWVIYAEQGTHMRTEEFINQVCAGISCDTALDMAFHMVHEEEMGE